MTRAAAPAPPTTSRLPVAGVSPDGHIRLPALTTAHSHAFQRAMRGSAQRRGAVGSDDFWSWRGQMYRVASSITPESLLAIGRVAFGELFRAGIRTVGEFHYLHHQVDGTPYDDRTRMSDVMIEAAKLEGLRIALLRVAYHRAGPGLPALPEQRRFCDADVDDVLRDVDALRKKYAGDPLVRVGIAPHSVRAVPPSWLPALAAYATEHDLPLHMHVSEQRREIEECLAETGKRPIELLADLGVIGPRFTAVHATHLNATEAALLGGAGAFACLCPSTERDLGDGLADITALRQAGVRLCTGIDSYVVTDPIDEMRSLETHERLRTQTRVTFQPSAGAPAEQLWLEGSRHGALACGFTSDGGVVRIARAHPVLALTTREDCLLDAIVFSGHAGMISGVEPA